MTDVPSRKALLVQALMGIAVTVWVLILAFQQISSPHDRLHMVRVGLMFATATGLIVWQVQRWLSLRRRQR
jgi:hypothetical protein